MPKIWTVSEIVSQIGWVLQDRVDLQNCWISGELSNYKNHRASGHWYFTLKDESSSLKAVMFKSRSERVRFVPSDGLKVMIRGNIRMYEREGTIQFYAEEMEPSGLGQLYLAFEQLKIKLAGEGLFDPLRKKKIPRYPQRIGIVTSPTGAAIRDILNIMERRHPKMSWVLAPAAVQGEAAPREVAQAIARLNRSRTVDVIIVGRGGGSLEELWAFNTEVVARAIAESVIPVISAVGHETDVTIADYVADLRAPTPSAAAELSVPILQDLQSQVNQLCVQLQSAMGTLIEGKRQTLERISNKGPLKDPLWRIDQNRQRLDTLQMRLQEGMTRFVADKNGILNLFAAKLNLLSPLAILGRGYSLTYDQTGNLLRSVEQVECHQQIRVRLGEGSLRCEVLEKEF
ncbi:exodeoxyribonuclease VII large subunit [Desulfosporosinus sp. BICA1-9]|uniref:exodeoxyribonuclease VII large subunit n=1 Tax=Desulfosporosinus sp. BICA1-9 TaxID=1531958 RepID=UPI00054B316B|nr:exodeoxyribonuclease VII large subunit [Desulfosporosinus sp. BICA1-9]KJS78785.1 MAG: exodeoxyribonuclease VII large subunit [Desulfosporosinus sp. BICA1-9]HBW35169.1 exodeoxyribonuclease VII large subunit [Desulfosporosinus sp.]